MNQVAQPWILINATPEGIMSIEKTDPYSTLISGIRENCLRVNIDTLHETTLHRVAIDKDQRVFLYVGGKNASEIRDAVQDVVLLAKNRKREKNDDEERQEEAVA